MPFGTGVRPALVAISCMRYAINGLPNCFYVSTRRVLLASLLAILQFLNATEAVAQPVPPNMPEPRGDHTATLLPSGEVLIAGGNNLSGQVASTVVYDW